MYVHLTIVLLVADFRLQNQTSTSGYLEMKYNDTWAPVVAVSGSDFVASNILQHYCKEVGIRSTAPTYTLHFGTSEDTDTWKSRACLFYRCGNIYLKCEDAKFLLSSKAGSPVLVKDGSNWYPFCIGHDPSRYEASLFCRAVDRPSLHAFSFRVNGSAYFNNLELPINCLERESSIVECIRSAQRTKNTCTAGSLIGVRCEKSDIQFGLGQEHDGSGIVHAYVRVRDNWKVVCDPTHAMTVKEARVICRQMNMSSKITIPITIAENIEIQRAVKWRFNVHCADNAASIDHCVGTVEDTSYCGPAQRAAITCSDKAPRYRLVNSIFASRIGRLEVYFNGTWAAVCPDKFGLNEAKVVCRSLGYSGSDINYGRGIFGTSAHPVMLRDLACTGEEPSLEQCAGFAWRMPPPECNRNHDIGVICKDATGEGQLRLVGGYDRASGRLEVYHNRFWGAVSKNGFGKKEVRVACKQITNSGRMGRTVSSMGALPEATADDIMLEAICDGHEIRLVDCRTRPWDYNFHSSTNVVYLACDLNIVPSSFRLHGGNASFGLLQVYRDNIWGTVCNRGLTNDGAKVICKALGLTSELAKATGGHITSSNSSRIWLHTSGCKNNQIRSCFDPSWGNTAADCTHWKDLEISCEEIDYGGAKFRLAGLDATDAGRLELYYKEEWGSICDSDVQENTAKVACRSLGLSTKNPKILARKNTFFGHVPDKIWLGNVRCHGSETSLLYCSIEEVVDVQSCSHSDDLVVTCGDYSDPSYPMRLVGGSARRDGRLEVQVNGVWGTVCKTGFDDHDAEVACRKLGLPTSNVQVFDVTKYGAGSGPIWFTNVACYGGERNLGRCLYTSLEDYPTCDDHSLDVAIVCEETKSSYDNGPIIGGIVVGIAVLVSILGMCCYFNAQRRKRSNNAAATSSVAFSTHRSPAPSAPTQNVVHINLVNHNTIQDRPPPYSAPESNVPVSPEAELIAPPPSYSELFPEDDPKPIDMDYNHFDIRGPYI